ncbi:MAG: DUF3800 domain-containing protein [Lutibacter sp.]|jgi:hypothetical protein
MSKTFNFYCDESCHLENDKQPFMFIGYVSCAYNQVKLHSSNIKKIKAKHQVFYETKWSGLSKSAYPLYNDLIEYFFATDLQFRAIVIDKSQLKHEDFNQNHDDFYYKMYFQLLSKKLELECNYNIYLDIKDTRSAKKVNGLKDFLNKNYIAVRNLQNIRSHESELMQLTDIITGALSYHLRGLNKVIAKNKIIEKIQQHSKHPLTHSTNKNQNKFNLFFIDLK